MPDLVGSRGGGRTRVPDGMVAIGDLDEGLRMK
jgi:hypothetical protein